jgi:hypothetical protein
MRRAGLVVVAIACGVTASRPAAAKRVSLTLRELVEASDIVVVAQVDSVTVAPEEKRYADGWTTHPRTATARVLDGWLGEATPTVTFSATKTWRCDTSYAEAGETVVLLLGARGEDGVRNIVNYGEGRFPVHARDGADAVQMWWPNQFRLPGVTGALVDLRTFERAVHGELTEAPAAPDPPPVPPNWLAPTGWPAVGSAIVFADIALAAILWRLARRRRRQPLGGAVRWPAMLAGSALGAWLAWRQLDLLLALAQAANQPDIPIVHLIWPLTALTSGLLAWLAGELAAGPSRRALPAALGSCLGCASVLLWFVFDPPVALTRAFADIQPLGLDVPQTVLAGLASAIACAVLRRQVTA